jgi:hypothetical protein
LFRLSIGKKVNQTFIFTILPTSRIFMYVEGDNSIHICHMSRADPVVFSETGFKPVSTGYRQDLSYNLMNTLNLLRHSLLISAPSGIHAVGATQKCRFNTSDQTVFDLEEL